MDTDTLIILSLLAAAYSCLLYINIRDKKQLIKQSRKEEKDRLARAERVRQLTGKL